MDDCITQTRHKINLMSHKRPESSDDLSFNYKLLSDWHNEFNTLFMSKDNLLKQKFVVKYMDYLANPSVMKKNSWVVE